MASVRSLGLHRPSAIPFLVAESLLPPDPSEEEYTWQTGIVEDGPEGPADEEIVYTRTCVVWSRGGIVKKVYRFDLEKEEIRHVLFTYFPVGVAKAGESSQEHCGAHLSHGMPVNPEGRESKSDTTGIHGRRRVENGSKTAHGLSRALVVVLKSQAHIFFLAGNSHIIPLPFEVDSVFPTPRGLLLQRKAHEDASKTVPRAPHNSFASSKSAQADIRSSQPFRTSTGKGTRPSTRVPKSNRDAALPRVFSLMDPHSELGLVVSSNSSRPLHESFKTVTFDSLDPAEEILYVSHKDEFPSTNKTQVDHPLVLVVTINSNTGFYTLWTARYAEESDPKLRKKEHGTNDTRSTRRSSHFGIATGVSTPAARPPTVRDSFGALGYGRDHSGTSHSQNLLSEGRADEADDIASQLGREFNDIGAPLKTSRRVISLLARADLTTSQDRATFSDLAIGNQAGSVPYGGARQSVGVNSNRASIGLRGSLPANSSIYSNNSSFLDDPVDRVLEELKSGSDPKCFENIGLQESMPGLPKEMILIRVESFPSNLTSGSGALPKSVGIRRHRIFTLCSYETECPRNGECAAIAICILDYPSKSLVVVSLKAERVTRRAKESGSKNSRKERFPDGSSLVVQATGIRHGSNIADACRIVDGEISRILTLGTTVDGQNELTLQSPWSTPVPVELPLNLTLHGKYGMPLSVSPNISWDGITERAISGTSLRLTGLSHPSTQGKVDLIDSQKRRHRIQIKMEPRNVLVRKIIKVCTFVLRDSAKFGDGILVGWWEVSRWLHSRKVAEQDLEWTAMVVVLFTMAVDFIETNQTQTPVKPSRKTAGLMRTSSGSYIDLENWDMMLDQETGSHGALSPWRMSNSWSWIIEQDTGDVHDSAPQILSETERRNALDSLPSRTVYPQNSYLIRCAALARDFLQSPQGEVATGSEGYLPTSICQDQNTRRTALCTVLVAMHLLREEQKLSISESESPFKETGILAPILAQIGGWLGWNSWTWKDDTYFGVEMANMGNWLYEDARISSLDIPPEPFAPPSIFSFLENFWHQPSSSFLTLLDIIPAPDRIPGRGKLWLEASTLTPRTFALNGFLSEVRDSPTSSERVELLLRWGLSGNIIETLPEGVSAPLFETIACCQVSPPTSWSSALLRLIDRDDLYMSMTESNSCLPVLRPQSTPIHDAVRDFHHIGVLALESDTINAFEASAEADRFSIMKLIFSEDRRFVEAARLLNQSKAPVAECIPEPEWSESDLLEAQKELVQLVTLRTLSVPIGRAMFMFNGRLPLLTEKLPIPSFSLQCVMKPSNVTISADRASFSEEKVCWAFFHNGVATGLAISKACKGIDTSWILFNKPQELTNRHAGFLLGLGLNGHLRSLAKWVAFKYLTPKHTMTSIGLLLGLSASYLGTMDTLITRLLSVHVTRMLPSGAAELNLSQLTQTAGLMGIGLLYCNSQHRRMSEIMLSEIENVEHEESTVSQGDLRGEGYRLAAGFALGLINIGKGKDLRGLRDMRIVERLLTLAVGTKNVDLVHVLDKATAGATVALMIIFMKTNDLTLAKKIDIPDTAMQFDYVRPDIFLLRTLARHLIMWDSICASHEWLRQNLPCEYQRRYRLSCIRRLSSNDMPFFNIVAGLCFAIGLRYAGSASSEARDILLSYLDQFIRICRLPALNYDGKLTRNSVRNCQDIVALSAAAVMSGTGDLALFRRLRSLHGRVDADTPYGSHMAAHMAIGMLFLGGGSHTLSTSDLAIASLLCAFYPIFPTTVLDNKCHLQAFRHMWVLAAEPRCLVPRDIDTRRPVSIPVSLKMKSGVTKKLTAPCLLPDLKDIAIVKVLSPEYWPLVLDFDGNDGLREKFRCGDQFIYVKRKAMCNPSESSGFASTLLGLSEAQDILPSSFSATSAKRPAAQLSNTGAILSQRQNANGIQSPSYGMWDWIFLLPSLQGLDLREKSLVMTPFLFQSRSPYPSDDGNTSVPPWLRRSVVDTRLILSTTVYNAINAASDRGSGLGESRDQLWQLRLLFGWIDKCVDRRDKQGMERKRDGNAESDARWNSNGLWLRKDVVEEAKWKVWSIKFSAEGV
ncbi:hypothetical protein VTN02DRAFT_2745 [Thermoascus thermophilus]